MATGVGLRVGAQQSIVAIVTGEGEADHRSVARETVLHMSADGDAALGGPAPKNTAHSVVDFVDKVGDPAGVVVDEGSAYRAEDLVATSIFCLVDLAKEYLDGPTEFCATYPADWSPDAVGSLRDALDYLGLRTVATTPESGDDPALTAALGAYRAVLATPAGATPPDPTDDELAGFATEELPVVAPPSAVVQAYSAAPLPSADAASAALALPAPERIDADPDQDDESGVRPRASLLAAAATLALLALGGGGAAIILQNAGSAESEAPPAPTAQPSITTTVPPVEPIAPIALSTVPPANVPVEPEPVVTRPPAPIPTTTVDEPIPTTTPTTTLEPPTSPEPTTALPTTAPPTTTSQTTAPPTTAEPTSTPAMATVTIVTTTPLPTTPVNGPPQSVPGVGTAPYLNPYTPYPYTSPRPS